MDEVRLQANEELIDTLGARLDDLEKRFGALLELLQTESVRTSLGLQDYDFALTKTSFLDVRVRSLKHTNARNRAVDELRQQALLRRLAALSPERLDELIHGASGT